jgi:hypothetical protein
VLAVVFTPNNPVLGAGAEVPVPNNEALEVGVALAPVLPPNNEALEVAAILLPNNGALEVGVIPAPGLLPNSPALGVVVTLAGVLLPNGPGLAVGVVLVPNSGVLVAGTGLLLPNIPVLPVGPKFGALLAPKTPVFAAGPVALLPNKLELTPGALPVNNPVFAPSVPAFPAKSPGIDVLLLTVPKTGWLFAGANPAPGVLLLANPALPANNPVPPAVLFIGLNIPVPVLVAAPGVFKVFPNSPGPLLVFPPGGFAPVNEFLAPLNPGFALNGPPELLEFPNKLPPGTLLPP